ncbi:MAG: hypothetical protein M3010_02755 [Candidatus Dormibacteraeota bacterium]|nr:hypothetical protein [Candidatus Dormibacteraeota bacterium]
MLPRLSLLARLASERETTRDPARLAELREDYRYLAAVCRNVLTDLEEDLAELPDPIRPGAPPEARVAYQMALIRRTNRLHRAVEAVVTERAARRRQAAND